MRYKFPGSASYNVSRQGTMAETSRKSLAKDTSVTLDVAALNKQSADLGPKNRDVDKL